MLKKEKINCCPEKRTVNSAKCIIFERVKKIDFGKIERKRKKSPQKGGLHFLLSKYILVRKNHSHLYSKK